MTRHQTAYQTREQLAQRAEKLAQQIQSTERRGRRAPALVHDWATTIKRMLRHA